MKRTQSEQEVLDLLLFRLADCAKDVKIAEDRALRDPGESSQFGQKVAMAALRRAEEAVVKAASGQPSASQIATEMESPGQPPAVFNVIDRHGGFTALMRTGDTNWRPGKLLKYTTLGNLVKIDRSSSFQLNDDVTMASYKVKGYPYDILVWFDNKTGQRIT